MRHRIAVPTAAGIVALAVGSVAVALLGVRPSPQPVDLDAPVPQDLVWTWINSCVYPDGGFEGGTLIGLSFDEDSVPTVEVGEIAADGERTIDAERSAAANSCLSARSVGMSRSREARPVERAQLYDWARRWQAPCLAVRGFDVTVPPRSDFFDLDDEPWYLLNTLDQRSLDFDTLLEVRLACPPMPAFLERQVVAG